VTTTDNRRLENIGRLHLALGHPVARFLIQELERAVLCRPDAIPDHVVTLGSRVLFRLEPVGLSAVRQLVVPHRHRSEGKQVSILSPLGAALIGLSEGDSMPYTNLAGAARVVTVETVAGRPQAQIASAP
jgi:regulator of nucleoside diphosphate kinase